MNRGDPEKPKQGADTKVPGQTTLPRFTSPLIINSASRRRSLFSLPRPKEGSARPPSSGSISDSKPASQNNTRIPRPASRPGHFSMSEAYRLAEEEEAAQGSPSPAPRSWRRRDSTEKRASKLNRQGIQAKPARDDDPEDRSLRSQQSDASDSTFDEKLRQFSQGHPEPEEPAPRINGLFPGSRFGNRIVEAGRGLVRRTSRGSIEGSPSPRVTKVAANSPSLLRRLSGRTDGPQNNTISVGEPLQPRPDNLPLDSQTPERSYAWKVDADFTASDLQASDSPPVVLGRSNTKIDQIRAREAEVNGRSPESSQQRPRNTRIDDIRALETEAALKFPDEPAESDETGNDAQNSRAEGDDMAPRRQSVSRTSTVLDELRSREIESLSRRALATARLDELRERNVGTSRSPSPDIARRPSREPVWAFSPLGEKLPRQANDKSENGVEAPTSTNLQNSTLGDRLNLPPVAAETGDNKDTAKVAAPHFGSQPANGSVAVGGGPASQAQLTGDNPRPSALVRRLWDASDGARHKRVSSAKSDGRPTVGFAGLQRSSSVESRLTKRGSFVHSDSDPTERIEGEMKLFAPLENQSERGSLRAPSPEPEEDAPDETPKPSRIEPLTQPTPKVTGAFVETPPTVKVERPKESVAAQPAENEAVTQPINELRRRNTDSDISSKTSLPRGEKDGDTASQHKRPQSTGGDRASGRSSSLSAHRRARSLSRGRRPLTNSAKPPTVRDDLLEIQRANQIDDSTLDDIADYLHQDHLEASLRSRKIKLENAVDDKFDFEKELEAYDRMSRSLRTGLLGIRSAKQGIERLEDKVSHADIKGHPPHTSHGNGTENTPASCPTCRGSQPPADTAVTYVHLPLPRFWYRRPKFRFTLLGLTLFLLSLWYIVESWMCYQYCKPEYCYPGQPCDWSADDPVWGYAIPVKLDQWVTGGQGRQLVGRLEPEVTDWLADLWDDITGTDIRTVDTSRYSWEQKRQYRRRLAKKGLTRRFVERPEDSAIFSARTAARKAQERTQSAQEMGYEVDEDDIIGDDEKA
ncbi:hypothetical protein VTI74DRAFT_9654 [Chaetomium olivicolor]